MSMDNDGEEQRYMKIDIDDGLQPAEEVPGRHAEKNEQDADSSCPETVIVRPAAPPGKQKPSGEVERNEIMGHDREHPGRGGNLYLSPLLAPHPRPSPGLAMRGGSHRWRFSS
jgi:hypothetical protein